MLPSDSKENLCRILEIRQMHRFVIGGGRKGTGVALDYSLPLKDCACYCEDAFGLFMLKGCLKEEDRQWMNHFDLSQESSNM